MGEDFVIGFKPGWRTKEWSYTVESIRRLCKMTGARKSGNFGHQYGIYKAGDEQVTENSTGWRGGQAGGVVETGSEMSGLLVLSNAGNCTAV